MGHEAEAIEAIEAIEALIVQMHWSSTLRHRFLSDSHLAKPLQKPLHFRYISVTP